MKALSFALVAASLVTAAVTPTRAQDQTAACVPFEAVRQHIEQIKGVTVRLDKAQTARVVAWFNEQPPESDVSYDLAVVARLADGTYELGLGNGESICWAHAVPADLMDGFYNAIVGDGA